MATSVTRYVDPREFFVITIMMRQDVRILGELIPAERVMSHSKHWVCFR